MSKRKVAERSPRTKRSSSPAPALGKTSSNRPAPTPKDAQQVSTLRTILVSEPGSALYRCSKCHLTAVLPGALTPVADLPDASQLDEKPLWLRCPDEGPRDLHLWDPLKPSSQRIRISFRIGVRQFSLCTRRVKQTSAPVNRGADALSYGLACSPRRMLGEAFAQDFISERGFAKRLDLFSLRPLFAGTQSERAFPVTIASINGWRLVPDALSPVGDWIREIPEWRAPLTIRDMGEVIEIAVALLTPRVPRAQDTSDSHTATIEVPFDLRFSLDAQWEEKRQVLQEIQDVLFTVSDRRGPSKQPDYEVWKRRFKCYVLRTYGALTSGSIARLVLPSYRRGDVIVRKDIEIVKSLLRKEKAKCE